MEIDSLSEAEKEPLTPKTQRKLSRIQKWTRAAVVGLLLPLAAATATTAYLERSHSPVAPEYRDGQKQNATVGTLSEERTSCPDLTEDEYLDLLASRLNTPERMGKFFDERIEHSFKGIGEPEEKGKDHWQTPEETIRREKRIIRQDVDPNDGEGTVKREVSVILGDCEDYSFLAQEILWRQGKVAHVVNFPGEGHSACIWIEKIADDQYHGFSLDNGGLIWNGKPFKNIDFSNPPSGLSTLTDAFDVAIEEYEGNTSYNMNPTFIPVSRLRGPLQYVDAVTLQAFNHDLPHLPSYVDFLTAMGVCATTYGTYRFTKRRKEGETWKEYFTKFRLI